MKENLNEFYSVLRALAKGDIMLLHKLVNPVEPIPEGGYGLSLDIKDKDGVGPVLLAVGIGRTELLRELVKPVGEGGYGLSLDVKDKNGTGPVLTAIWRGQTQLLRELIKPVAEGGYGLSLDVKDNNGAGPVLMAVGHGQIELLRELVKPVAEGGYGLSLNVKNNHGMDPVIIAIITGRVEMLRELVKPVAKGGYGLSLDVKDNNGAGPVLMAVGHGQIEMLRELVKPVAEGGYGLSLDVKDKNGSGPVLMAVWNGQTKLLRELVKPVAKGGYGLPLDVKDRNGDCAVVMAINNGRIEMLRELVKPVAEGGYGLSLNVKVGNGTGPVLMAVGNGRIEMLRELVKPVAEGGYGLSLDVKDKNGNGAILMAIWNGQTKLLRELVKPVAEGGYGLSIDVTDNKGRGPVLMAVWNNQTEALRELVKPISEYGYGLRPPEHLFLYVAKKKQKQMFIILFTNIFNQKLEENKLDKAFALASDGLQFDFVQNDLRSWLRTRYQKLLMTYMSQNDLENVQKVALALEGLAPGDSHYYLGKCYEERRDFSKAFTSYLVAFNTANCENKLHAGIAIANIIFTGDVILDAQGKLNEEKIESFSHMYDEQQTLTILQARVIAAYEYLYKNDSVNALQLKARFNEILCENLEVNNNSNDNVTWQPQVARKYMRYYDQKNSDLLKEKSFINSLDGILQGLEKSPTYNTNRSTFFSEHPSEQVKPNSQIESMESPCKRKREEGLTDINASQKQMRQD